MTWLKLSDDFSDECAKAELSDAAYRTHVEGLNWAMRRETGGRVTPRDVRRFAETLDPDKAIGELLAAGYWAENGDGYQIRHHMEHQPEPDLIERRRELTAERVRKHRRRKAGLPDGSTDVDATHHVTPLQNALPGTGRDGTGRDGEELFEEKNHDVPRDCVSSRCGFTPLDRINGRRCDDCPSSVKGAAA